MVEIVNLRMARKARARLDAEANARASRAKHGRSKTEKRIARAEQDRIDRSLEGARIETPSEKS